MLLADQICYKYNPGLRRSASWHQPSHDLLSGARYVSKLVFGVFINNIIMCVKQLPSSISTRFCLEQKVEESNESASKDIYYLHQVLIRSRRQKDQAIYKRNRFRLFLANYYFLNVRMDCFATKYKKSLINLQWLSQLAWIRNRTPDEPRKSRSFCALLS